MTSATPTLTLERMLLKDSPFVIACDEVGRGALAGPVAVGAVAIDAAAARKRVPEGLRDSKLVPERQRPLVAERARLWTCAHSVGWASPAEIDEHGIMAALGMAAARALEALREQAIPLRESLVLLDGNHDYISRHGMQGLRVRPVIKADRDCASAAAASVIAKVERDQMMSELDDPGYGWAKNKGYASPAHREALRAYGLSAQHRASWAITDAARLPLF